MRQDHVLLWWEDLLVGGSFRSWFESEQTKIHWTYENWCAPLETILKELQACSLNHV